MSFILDALRKADAERERGTVPGIHAQPMFAGPPQTAARRAARPWVWVAAAAVLVLLVAAVSWWLRAGGAPEPVAQPLAVTKLPAPTPVVAAPAPAAVIAPATEPAPAARKPAVPVAPKPVASPKAEVKASGPAASAAPDNRVYALHELPDDVRRQLPATNVGGSMYSAVAANRILIINGQVLHEGEQVAPGLVLKQIRLKAAMLVYKGYQYLITY